MSGERQLQDTVAGFLVYYECGCPQMSHSRSCLGQTGPASLQAAAALSRMKMSSRSKHLSKQVFSAKQSAMGIGPRLQESETQAQRRNHVIPADGAALCNAVGLHFHDTKQQCTRRCAGWPLATVLSIARTCPLAQSRRLGHRILWQRPADTAATLCRAPSREAASAGLTVPIRESPTAPLPSARRVAAKQ